MEWVNENLVVYKDLDRDISKFDNILKVLRQHNFNGVIQLRSFGDVINIPVVEGETLNNIPDDFLVFSVYRASKNFIINYFQLPLDLTIQYRETEPIWVNLESFGMNIKELFKRIEKMGITGFVKVRNRIRRKHSYIFLLNGAVIAGESDGLKGVGVLEKVISEIRDYPCDVNIFSISPEEFSIYLSKRRYIMTLKDRDTLSEMMNDEHIYYLQVVYPEYTEGYLSMEDLPPESKRGFIELYRIDSVITKFNEVDIYKYINEFDRINVIKPQDLGILFFCPACWSQIGSSDQVCPNCGFDLEEFHKMEYEYKILMALEHPVKEWRKNTVYVIGLKRLEEAVPYLDIMIDKESDPFILIEIVDTLKKIGTISVLPLLEKLSIHKYALVRNKAKQTLFQLSKQFKNL
ncbi:MAG: hypothetical protein N2Z80_04265 [Hydrogenothermaceae bacterium]|nr:hypothetical protein [Hydrogenothermaceae bacterium]